ncbi:MAG: C39 family peptidase [Ardenticatenaceae bacterium]
MIYWLPLLAGLLVACSGGERFLALHEPVTPTARRATATLAPTFTHSPTATLTPTATPPPSATPEPSATPRPSATLRPSATPTVAATATVAATSTAEPTATAAAVVAATARQVLLPNISHDYQRLNNCGPTTAAMTLSYYGFGLTQYDIAPLVKGADTDKNVAPEDLTAYLRSQGFAAPIRVNGDLEMLRALLSNGIPVIVEQWLERPDDALTGHYRLVRGYDQDAGVFVVNDSYLGPNLRYPDATFDRWWRAFNRLYIPVYRAEQEPLVRAIVGESVWETEAMWRSAVGRAEQELAAAPDLYGWFNLGTARLRLGDVGGSVEAFDRALAIGLPERMLWYQFALFEAFNAAGQYARTIELSELYVGLKIEEIHYQRGIALEGLGQAQAALAEYQAAVAFNARYGPALEAARRLSG